MAHAINGMLFEYRCAMTHGADIDRFTVLEPSHRSKERYPQRRNLRYSNVPA